MLKDVFDKLTLPTGKKNDLYTTEKIFKKNHKIGKNFKNQPSLLFNSKKSTGINNNYLGKNMKLKNNKELRVHFFEIVYVKKLVRVGRLVIFLT